MRALHITDDVTTMVAAALFVPVPGELLQRAAGAAQTTRDRQLVEIALGGKREARASEDANVIRG